MNVFEFTRAQRAFYEQNKIPLFGGIEYSQYDVIKRIDHYSMDSYVDGNAYDDVIGEFPFDNRSKYRVLLEARATDFDRKHIEVPAENSSREAKISAMFATKALRQHMDDINFNKTLNDLTYTRAKYGGVLVTKHKDGIYVEKWQQLITDQADIMSAPRIKRMFMSPSEIAKMHGIWDNVDKAIKAAEQFRFQELSDRADTKAESPGHLIEVFVVEGDLSLSMLKEAQAIKDGKTVDLDPDDNYEYEYGRIIFCGADWTKDENGKKKDAGIIFYAEQEDMPLQKYLARNPIAGRGLGEGVVESLFEHQKWHNFTKTEEMRMIAIAGKKLYVTDDPDILANIFDEGVDHGTVLRVSQGKTLTELNQLPTGTPIYQNIRAEWDDSADKVTSSFQAAIGDESKSGTPFRAQYLQNIEAHSQFEQYREEIGIFLKEIVEDWLLPDALKKAAKKDELYDSFTPQELMLIDDVVVENQLTDKLIEATLKGEVIDPEMVEVLREEMRQELGKEGDKRSIKGIQNFIENAQKHVTVHTTDEARNKAVLFESYANLLALLSPEDPRFNALLDKVMQALGISQEELTMYQSGAIQAQQPRGQQLSTEAIKNENKPRAQAAMSQL